MAGWSGLIVTAATRGGGEVRSMHADPAISHAKVAVTTALREVMIVGRGRTIAVHFNYYALLETAEFAVSTDLSGCGECGIMFPILNPGLLMLKDFRDFIIKQNFLALAIAVVLGGAIGKVVQAVVDSFIMPIVAASTPGGNWQEATWDVGSISFGIGNFASVFLNFLIVAFVVWRIAKLFERPAEPAAPARTCQFCRMEIDAAASRCPHCTSQL
jgi:large conductance mechanosensitive channel